MIKWSLWLFMLILPGWVFTQPAGYYNGIENKTGNELKTALNQIIKGHVDFSYSQAKYIINYSDADPANASNVILFYTQRSQDADTYGTGSNDINREHVWAKSHGDFSGVRPMDGDAFNLRPTDGSVNIQRSNRDFDECLSGCSEVSEAPGTFYSSSVWEPSDAVKGQVARIIFYMATRYEGMEGELDLSVVDEINTAPQPEHGKLSTLLQWNRDFPPTDFERRRNERIFRSQQNRNPFIDYPELADLIWDGSTPSDIDIAGMDMLPAYPKAGSSATISADITSTGSITGATLYWGDSWNSETQNTAMTAAGDTYSGTLNLTGFSAGEYIYYKLVATDGNETTTHGSYLIPEDITAGQLTPISQIQGTGDSSPLNNQTVTTTGKIVANFDNTFYIQDGSDPYSGMCIFGSTQTGEVGDSVIITGKVTEYQTLTEVGTISYFYNYKTGTSPQPSEVTVSQINEMYEGMLVQINNAQFADGGTVVSDNSNSFSFSDGTGSMILFSRYGSRLVGYELPSGVVSIKGVVSQYQGEYQILVERIDDISAGVDNDPPVINLVSVLDSTNLIIDFNERIDITTAEDISHYSLNNNISVVAAFLYENTHVILTITGMKDGAHTLTVNGIEDEQGNILVNGTADFSYTAPVGIDSKNTTPVEIYPSPVHDGMLSVRSPKPFTTVSIYDIAGVKVMEWTGTEKMEISLDVGTLENGIFIMRITDHRGSAMVRKFVVNRK